ncbi:hypothetical protein [Methanospirillum sp.]
MTGYRVLQLTKAIHAGCLCPDFRICTRRFLITGRVSIIAHCHHEFRTVFRPEV